MRRRAKWRRRAAPPDLEGNPQLRRLIVRRLVENLRAQQWLAVVIDLAIVILGVFVGIEVANWNERRQDRQEERRYYQQIIGDLDSDMATLATARERSFINDQSAEFVLSSLADETIVRRQPGRFAMSIVRAGFLYLPQPSRQTYDELISTGNLRLLRAPEMKVAISRYYALFADNRQWDAMVRDQQSQYWSEIAGIVPRPALRSAIRFVEPSLSGPDVSRMVTKARSRPRLPDLVTGMAVHQEWIRRDCERFEVESKALRAMLQRRLATMS
ncbi:MAG: hypothetical protein LH465_06890 [Sphingomonas bacterium]|nr:hypothetical protein [Sphingomonas bacterium]